jgi:hypothetical protein
MSENRSLNSLFARLDESKANRANEANREREKAAEEAEKERQKKKVEESAVEKYRVYDDDYEPEVMIPKGNPGAVQQPAKPKKEKKGTKEQEMDEITDGNPFINTLFRRSSKTQDQNPTAAAKPSAQPAAPAQPASAPQPTPADVPSLDNEQEDDTLVFQHILDGAKSPDANAAQSVSQPENDGIEIDLSDIENGAAEPVKGDDEPIETSLSFSQNEPEAPAVSDSFSSEIPNEQFVMPDTMSDNDGAQKESVQEDEADEWPRGMSAPHFGEEENSSSDIKPVGDEEANAFLYARFDKNNQYGAFGLCIDTGKNLIQSSYSGDAADEVEYALRGAIEMFRILEEHDIHAVTVYTEPELSKAMKENARRLINGKSEICRKYIEMSWKAMTSIGIEFDTNRDIHSEYAQLALATARYLAFREDV